MIHESESVEQASGPIDARGAFIDEFEIIAGSMSAHETPAAIERDRPFFVARPGFYRKLLPLRTEDNGRLFSGGRYLFGTFDQAADFGRWIREEFRLDGKLFAERPWAKDLTCMPFHVVGAHDFKNVLDSQVVVRLERWKLSGERGASSLESAWRGLRDRAAAELASIWLLYSDEQREIALVTVADRIGQRSPAPDNASLRALESRASLAEEFVGESLAHRTFDRTSWIFTIWFAPDHTPLQLWPNSPPLPGLEQGGSSAAPLL